MRVTRLIAAALIVGIGSNANAAGDRPPTWDGLVEVKPEKLQVAYLLPGADFRPYTKIMIDRTEVAFRKDWVKDINDTRGAARRVTDADVADVVAAARTKVDDIFQESFTKAGYTAATAPAADTLRVSIGVLNLYVNAVDPINTGGSPVITAEAGEATLVIELRDSLTGALLGRVLDRRVAEHMGDNPQVSTRISNKQDFRELCRLWADFAAGGLGKLKAISPLPAELQPGQKLK
jgi:hypothetical protein